jgi:hypothetical protein
MSLYQFPAEIESQTCPPNSIGSGVLCPHKAIEDIGLLVEREPYTLVPDIQERYTRLAVFTDGNSELSKRVSRRQRAVPFSRRMLPELSTSVTPSAILSKIAFSSCRIQPQAPVLLLLPTL